MVEKQPLWIPICHHCQKTSSCSCLSEPLLLALIICTVADFLFHEKAVETLPGFLLVKVRRRFVACCHGSCQIVRATLLGLNLCHGCIISFFVGKAVGSLSGFLCAIARGFLLVLVRATPLGLNLPVHSMKLLDNSRHWLGCLRDQCAPLPSMSHCQLRSAKEQNIQLLIFKPKEVMDLKGILPNSDTEHTGSECGPRDVRVGLVGSVTMTKLLRQVIIDVLSSIFDLAKVEVGVVVNTSHSDGVSSCHIKCCSNPGHHGLTFHFPNLTWKRFESCAGHGCCNQWNHSVRTMS